MKEEIKDLKTVVLEILKENDLIEHESRTFGERDKMRNDIVERFSSILNDLQKLKHQKDIEKIEGMSGWLLDYVPASWQDKDEDPEFIVKQDVLNILKDK